MGLQKKLRKKEKNKIKKRNKRLRKLSVALCIWIFIIALCLYFYIQSWLDYESFLFGIYVFLQENLMIWWIVFLSLYILRPLLFIPASPLELLAVMVYGWYGALIIVISILSSIIINYWVWWRSKKYLEMGLKDSKMYARFQKHMHGKLFFNVLFLRLVPFPFDVWSFLCGALRFRFRAYVVASFLGALPSSIIIFMLGLSLYQEHVESFDGLFDVVDLQLLSLAWFAFIGLYVIIFFIEKYFLKNKI